MEVCARLNCDNANIRTTGSDQVLKRQRTTSTRKPSHFIRFCPISNWRLTRTSAVYEESGVELSAGCKNIVNRRRKTLRVISQKKRAVDQSAPELL